MPGASGLPRIWLLHGAKRVCDRRGSHGRPAAALPLHKSWLFCGRKGSLPRPGMARQRGRCLPQTFPQAGRQPVPLQGTRVSRIQDSQSSNERVVEDAKQTQNSTAALKGGGGAQLSGVISALMRLAVPAKGAELAAVPEACLRARSAVAQAALLGPVDSQG